MIYLEVLDWNLQYAEIGYFDDNLETKIIKSTNSEGIIKVTYYGPLLGEYGSSFLTIYALLVDTDQYPVHRAGIYDEIPIRLIYYL